jgi:SAM-dependent methyltransferase
MRKAALRRFVPRLLWPGWPDEARRVVQEPVFAQLAKAGPPRGRTLNAGCGEGLYSAFLESYPDVSEIANIDLTQPNIRERRSDARHTDAIGSVTQLPFEDASIDWVLCTEVIEHVEDDSAAAVELGRVLKPGGYALISVPTPPAPHDPEHVREGYTLPALGELLDVGGFEVLASRYCFRMPMRALVVVWRWQRERLGGGRRNLMPRLGLLAFAYADRWLSIGRPWDLVVLARRR